MESIPCFQKVEELNAAIRSKNYEKVQEMLADPQVPVNLGCYCRKYIDVQVMLPLETMFISNDSRMARLFLDCPRIDWLAPTSNRNLHLCQEEFGYEYEVANDFGPEFYYIGKNFAPRCPEEAKLIYERIIGELAKDADEKTVDNFLLESCQEIIPFKVATGYSKNLSVKNGNLQTVLHLTKNLEVIKLAIELGAEVDAKDDEGETPLLRQCYYKNFEIIDYLLEKGADRNYISPHNVSFFTRRSLGSEFLAKYGLTEELFRAELRGGATQLLPQFLQEIFKKYPHYQQIFEADLPQSLCSLHNPYESHYFKNLSEEQVVEFIKNLIKCHHTHDAEIALNRKRILNRKYADVFLHEAVKIDYGSTVYMLIRRYGASLNTIVEGKTPLFHCKFNQFYTWKTLFNDGADPSIKCDGYEFFEREEGVFMDRKEDLPLSELLPIIKRGVDLCKPGEKTGKSFVEYLNPSLNIRFGLNFVDEDLSIPVTKVTKLFFDELSKKTPSKVAVIDEDGNTIAHYAALAFNESAVVSKTQAKILAVKIGYWKKYVNKAGKTPYDLIVESKHFYAFAKLLNDLASIKQFFKDCIAKHGDRFFKQRGGQMLLSALRAKNFDLADYLCDERGVSLDRLVGETVVIYEALNFCSVEDYKFFIKRRRFPPTFSWKLFTHGGHEVLPLFLEKIEDLSPHLDIFFHSLESFTFNDYQEFSESMKILLTNERVSAYAAREGYSLWDQNYFRLCNSRQKFAFLRRIGVDATVRNTTLHHPRFY